ncbi:MAG: hypothetical protein QXI05_02400 [Candidatus Bathyarchaeia archaeon]
MELIEKLEKKLPEKLRLKWREARYDDSDLHRAMKLIVAFHLLSIGHNNIEFEYCVEDGGKLYYVDVCDLDGKAFIECVRESEPSAIRSKYTVLKRVKPDFKVIVAIRDVMGWEADKYASTCDDVWVLRIDGSVLDYRDWPTWRIQYLLEPLSPAKIEILSKIYKYARCVNKMFASSKAHQIREFSEVFELVLRELEVSNELRVLLKDRKIRTSEDRHIEYSHNLIREVKREIMVSLLELINRLLEISKPYKVSLVDDESLRLEYYNDVSTWLGNEFSTDDINEIEERGRRNLEREISLLKKHFQIMDPAEEIPILSEELREATERVKSKNIMLFNSKLLTMI